MLGCNVTGHEFPDYVQRKNITEAYSLKMAVIFKISKNHIKYLNIQNYNFYLLFCIWA